jgi:hypothetical protein
MFKMFLAFAMLYCFFFLGIRYTRRLTGKQRWSLVKMIAYSGAMAILTILAMTGFVLMF